MTRGQRFIAALAALGLAVPPIVDFATGGTRRLVSYFAADAFYYLTVARNLWTDGFPSFDRVHATNGFHPLWQFLLTGVYGAARSIGISDDSLLYVVAVIVIVLIATALLLIARAFVRARGELPSWFPILPVGAFAMAISPLWKVVGPDLPEMNPFEGSAPLWGSLYMAINGMETGVLLVVWALSLVLFVERPIFTRFGSAIALGIALSLVVLARLDHAAFAIFPGLTMLSAARREPRALGRAIACGVAAAIPLSVYVASNVIQFDAVMPISGSLKTSFPHPTHDNFQNAFELLAAQTPGWWLERATRALQLFGPMFVAVVVIAKLRPPRAERVLVDPAARFDAFLRSTAWAVLTLGAYDALFVPWVGQGHWYFPLSTLFVSIALLRGWSGKWWARELDRSRAAPIIAIASSLIAITFFLSLHRHEDHHAHFADYLIRDAPILRERFGSERPRMVEFDDGIVAWGSGFPSMPATGLTLDPDGARRAHEGGLFPLAVERGHLWFASTIVPVGGVEANVRRSWPNGHVEVVYRAPDGFFGVVRLTPR
jgi:hypothetical protein